MSNDYSLNPQAQQYLKLAHKARAGDGPSEGPAVDCYRAAIDETRDVQGLLAIANDLRYQGDGGYYVNMGLETADRLTLTSAALNKALDAAKSRSEIDQIAKDSKDIGALDVAAEALDKQPSASDRISDPGPRVGRWYDVTAWRGALASHKTDQKFKLDGTAEQQLELARKACNDGQFQLAEDLYGKVIDATSDAKGLINVADDMKYEVRLRCDWGGEAGRIALEDKALTKAAGQAQDQGELETVLEACGDDDAIATGKAVIGQMSALPPAPANAGPHHWWDSLFGR